MADACSPSSDGSDRIPDPPLKHLFDGDSTNVYNDEICNLCAGTPGPDLLRLCADIFEKATKHRMDLEREDAYIFQYGATSGPYDFREELSRFLSKRYNDPVRREDLFLTCGATHGLQLILNSFLEPDGVIFVEEVTYMIAISVFREFTGLKVVPVPFTETGVVPEELERIARKEKSAREERKSTGKPFWGMFYTIPVYHNPTGICASQEVCAKVVRVARDLDLLVVCDDVYNLLRYSEAEPAPRRLFSVDRSLPGPGHVISNGSFSKILAPGSRVGWLEAPGRLVERLRNSGFLRSGGGVNPYMAGLITSALQLGLLDTHLDKLIGICKGRMQALCATLTASLPEGCSMRAPAGGYFVWVRLPAWVDAQRLHHFAREAHRVSAFPGSIFAVADNADHATEHRHCIRLAIAFHDERKLAAAARDLCAAIAEFMQRERGGVK